MLGLREGGRYLDATVGLGGHAEVILGRIGPDGILVGTDRDEEALKSTAQRIRDRRLVLRKSRFSELEETLRDAGVEQLDGVLMDFGVSMLHLRGAGRGFSFLSDDPLDMRMDASEPLTAAEIVNTWPERELERVIREYGEEWRARRIARKIVALRARGRIGTCRELAEAVAAAVGRRGRIHPATKTFQALRIAVNDELRQIRAGLDSALRVLSPGGRLVAISYHSLEDRTVKNFMKGARAEGRLRILTKKPLRAGREEVMKNPSARSARLRAGEAV